MGLTRRRGPCAARDLEFQGTRVKADEGQASFLAALGPGEAAQGRRLREVVSSRVDRAGIEPAT